MKAMNDIKRNEFNRFFQQCDEHLCMYLYILGGCFEEDGAYKVIFESHCYFIYTSKRISEKQTQILANKLSQSNLWQETTGTITSKRLE